MSNVTYLNYNNQELLTNASFPDLSSLNWQYDLLGRVTNRFDGADNSLQYVYNNQSLLTSVVNVYGLLWGCYRDALGRVVTATNINNVLVTDSYDILNRLTNRAWTGGGVENWGYASNGLVAYTNQDSQWVHFGRDGAGRMTALTNAVQTESFSWSALDELASLTDGLNHTTTWTYNQYGWLTNKANTLGTSIIQYAYDADGRLTNRWMMGTNTGYTYDAVGNLKTIVYPALTITNFYDAINELTNMLDAVGATKFTYTQIGQLASETAPWSSDTVSLTYNQRHRCGLTLSQPSGTWSQTYSYDNEWRMTSITSPAGSFTYVPGGASATSPLISLLSLPNAAYITNTYNALARLTSTSLLNYWGHVLDGYGYGLDALGLRTNLTRELGLATNGASIGYDGIGELTNWSGTNAPGGHLRHNEQLAYQYDAGGNLIVRTNDALVQTFAVDSLNQLSGVTRAGTFTETGSLSQPFTSLTVNGGSAQTYADLTFAATNLALNNGLNTFTNVDQNQYGVLLTNITTANLPTPVNFQYDANGNLTNDGTRSFQYDAENQLTNVYVASAWQVGFVYDGLNRRRITRDYTWSGSWVETNEIRFIYDGMLVLQERDTNNNPQATYTRGLDLSLSRQGAGGIGGLLARTDSAGSYFFHTDGSGNITALMDGYQRIVARYEYDPFGRMIGKWGTLADANRYRFSTKEFIPQAGIYQYGYRFYEPNFQRWLNRDPIQEVGGINLYEFTANSAINRVDLFGLAFDLGGGLIINNNNGVPTVLQGGDTLRNPVEVALANYDLSGNENYLNQATAMVSGGFILPSTALDMVQNAINNPDGAALLAAVMAAGANITPAGDKGEPEPVSGSKLKLPCPTKRVPSAQLRKKWEDATKQKWPKDPNTGRNYNVAHKIPLADGGDNSVENIEPMPHHKHPFICATTSIGCVNRMVHLVFVFLQPVLPE